MSERCSVCGLRKDEPAGSSACNWGNMHRPAQATVSAAASDLIPMQPPEIMKEMEYQELLHGIAHATAMEILGWVDWPGDSIEGEHATNSIIVAMQKSFDAARTTKPTAPPDPEAWPEIESIEFASVEDRKKCEKLLREWNSRPTAPCPLAVLRECRKFVRGRHSVIPLGQQSLLDKIDALIAQVEAWEASQKEKS